jgi:cell division protein FtsW
MRKILSFDQKPSVKSFDLWLTISIIGFCLFGLLMIYEASNVMAFRDFGDKYKFVKDQFAWTVIGFGGLIFTMYYPYKKYMKYSVVILVLIIISLVAVFIPGIGVRVGGAHRWIGIGSNVIQPSEFTKLAVILYLSSWLTQKKVRLIHFLLLFGVLVGLVVLQPDLGTAIILSCILLAMYFLSDAPLYHFFVLIPIVVSSVIVLAFISPYRFQRVLTYLNPNADPLGVSYHIRQILISLGAGGFWGLGLGASRQKYQFLPAATTDSIFAIIGEEFGFLGCFILIMAFCFLVTRIYIIAKNASDKQSFLLAGGILALISFQIMINLGATVVLFPLTGVPLPFISYGGSNLLVSLLSMGIVLQISRNKISNSKKRW